MPVIGVDTRRGGFKRFSRLNRQAIKRRVQFTRRQLKFIQRTNRQPIETIGEFNNRSIPSGFDILEN